MLTRVNGKVQRFSVGTYPNVTLADARDQARTIITDAATGISPKGRRAKAEAQRLNSVAAVCAEFMKDHGSKLRSGSQLQRIIDKEVVPVWGDRAITEISRGDVKSLLRAKAADAPIAANRLASLVSKLFAWCLDEELVTTSPAIRLKRAKEQPRERALTDHEIALVWQAFTRCGYPYGSLFQMLLICGQRRSETAAMRWADIDGNTWKLPGATSKTGQGHAVPLPSLAQEVLAHCPHVSDYVFSAGAGRGALQGWDRPKKRVDAFVAEPIAAWTLHDLRRSAATGWRSLKVDRLVVSKLLNHTESGVTKLYDRYALDQEKITALAMWSDKLRAIITGFHG